MKRLLYLAICIFAAMAAAAIAPSLVNSFGNEAGKWEFTPLTISDPNEVFIGLCSTAAVLALMFGVAWLIRHGNGKVATYWSATILGTALTAAGIWLPAYWFSGFKEKTFTKCWELFESDIQSFLMASVIISLLAATVGIFAGGKAFYTSPLATGGPPDNPGASAKTDDDTSPSGMTRVWRFMQFHRASVADA